MGAHIVFQTPPPQPASNARITCPPVLVGGPEASQKGLGDCKPQKLVFRSAIVHLKRSLQSFSRFAGDLGCGTSFMPRQISQTHTPIMPSQPNIRTKPAIWIS